MDRADAHKQESAQVWRAEPWRTRRGRVSFQVLDEFYVNALRMQPDARDAVRAEIRDLLLWHPVVTDTAVLEAGWKIQDR